MSSTGAPLLAAHDVAFAYRRDEPIVTRWSAEFHAGTVTALTGPSGSGKSTLLFLLGLMLRPLGGEVHLSGTRVDLLPDDDRARLRAHRFGFVFQDAALDATRTVLDNVVETALYRRQPRSAALATARALMRRFGVDVRAHHRPGQISGGQAQRIALCRALLGNPAVVLADEPTGNLDPASSRTVVTALKEHAAAGGCVVIATHDPRVVAACDRHLSLGALR
ncbi:MAG TPA: ATP-binding cassette domain-containing protein [Natronosporangium sp.]|nr:ATP-binding cassette domain-containing protein [Natronosporangium sp.]